MGVTIMLFSPSLLFNSNKQKHRGFSLLEMAIVVLIVSLTAAITMLNLSTSESYRLDNATRELAEAFRYARAEAIRTGTTHGVGYFSSTPKFSVYRLVASVPTYDIYHPVDKKLYSLDFSSHGNQAPVQLSSVTLLYGGGGTNQDYMGFDNQGIPHFISGATHQMLDNGSIVLEYAGQTRTISISPMTGRVKVQ